MADNPYATPHRSDPPPAPRKTLETRVLEFIVVLGICLILVALMLPATSSRYPRRRYACKNNLKQIGIALHNYHDDYGAFPPAWTVDGAGKRLHSWRTLLLPYLDEVALYEKIDLTKPWTDPRNAAAYSDCPEVFRCPGADLPANRTAYLAVVGSGRCFHPTQPRRMADVTDGSSQTLAVVEVARPDAVHWMAPLDLRRELIFPTQSENGFAHTGVTQVLMLDGSVFAISTTLSHDLQGALMTIAGGEEISDDDY